MGRQQAELISQGRRFALAGMMVAVFYLLVTTALVDLGDVRFQAALLVGFCTSTALHFTLQRCFVWRGESSYALKMRSQVGRYLTSALTQYGLTALSTARLPGLLGVPVEVIYILTALGLTVVNFVIFRHVVFHREDETLLID